MRSGTLLVLSIASAIWLSAGCTAEVSPTSTAEAAIVDCTAGARPSAGTQLVSAFGGATFSNPIELVQAPGDRSRFYLVEKEGRIRILTRDSAASTIFADIRTRVNSVPNEAGLLGLALHPRFLTNGEVYLSYTAPSTTSPSELRAVVARAKSRDGGKTLDVSSIEELITFDDPYTNHNGGHIAFGPDGYLYFAMGDGGSGGDPLRNGQNRNTWFGKIHRIDIDRTTGYGIPSDNPFASGGGKAEIFAYGLRNPWKFTFDRTTGDLWAGDVGQSALEEVDKIVKGGNYGWSEREGNRCYRTGCGTAGFIEPVATYGRSEGISITGGYVYRGTENAGLTGSYVYGDFGSGRIWALPATGGTPRVLFDTSGTNPSSFAEDADGELYVLDYNAGRILKIAPGVSSGGLPRQLSASGCFLSTDPTRPSARLVPYDVNAPLWSDGATKERHFALPVGGKITVNASGDWDFPVGTVTTKTFFLGTKRIETRLFVRHTDGNWAGYSYEWNDTGTDATLLDTGKSKSVGAQTWSYPSRGECMNCHQSAAGFTLGLETTQLNREESSSGRTENQLTRLTRLGVFATGVSFTGAARLSAYDDPTASTENKARSYLHSNCSFCHRPGAVGRGSIDFRFGTSFDDSAVCNVDPEQGSLGVASAKIFAPGAPDRSVLSLRMAATDDRRMPPLGSRVVDTQGTGLIDRWIRGTTSCP